MVTRTPAGAHTGTGADCQEIDRRLTALTEADIRCHQSAGAATTDGRMHHEPARIQTHRTAPHGSSSLQLEYEETHDRRQRGRSPYIGDILWPLNALDKETGHFV